MAADELLGVICRISKNSEIETPFDAIATLNDDTVFVRLKKIIAEQHLPLGMKELPLAMCHKCITRAFII